MWWMTQSVIHQKNLMRYGSPHVDNLSTWGKLSQPNSKFNVFKLSTLTLSVLQLTSTWHLVKPRWNPVSAAFQYLPNDRNTVALWWVTKTVTHHLEVVNGQNVHLPPSHNAQILVGDHFDHQPDNRNALLCKSGGYHFGNHHIPVTFGANNAFHYPPHTRNSQRRMPMTTEQWERENQDTLMEYFIDGDPSVRRIQCEYCRKVIYTQTRNRKYCSFQTCGHKMLNLRKSLKKRVERGKYTCACCGKQFLPIRADARYCSNACRQKDYRHRKTAAHTSLLGTWQSLSSSLSVLLLSSKVALPILGSAKIP